MDNAEDYIITKRTSIGERKGVNWNRLKDLEKEMWLDASEDFKEIKRRVLLEAIIERIIRPLNSDTFFLLTNEGYVYPIINCESYGFDYESELREYAKVFHKEGTYHLAKKLRR